MYDLKHNLDIKKSFFEYLDDHSRVRLSTDEYINANYVDVN